MAGDVNKIVVMRQTVGDIFFNPTQQHTAPWTGNACDLDTENPPNGWVHMGYTQDGIEAAVESEDSETEVDQVQEPVITTAMKETGTVKTKLAECDQYKQGLVCRGAYTAAAVAGGAPNTLTMGNNDIVYGSVAIVSPGAAKRADGTRVDVLYFFPMARASKSWMASFKKGETKNVPAEFDIFNDAACTHKAGAIMVVIEETVAAASSNVKTLSSGVLTLDAGQTEVVIAGESDAADALTSIAQSGAEVGDRVVCRIEKAANAITFTDSAALVLEGEVDFVSDALTDRLVLEVTDDDPSLVWTEVGRSTV